MSWVFLALFSALVSGGRRVYEKNLTKSFGNFGMGFIIQAFALLPTLILFFFLPLPNDIWHLPWQFWWPLLVIWFVIYPVQTYFLYRSIREGEIVQVTPVKAILPVFNMLTSIILLRENPSVFGVIGVLIIFFGTYLILTEKAHGQISSKYNKSVIHMILAMFCIAVGSSLDKIAINVSTPVFYSFVNTLGASIIFLVLIFIYRQKNDLKKINGFFWPLVLLGVFQALAYTATMMAFAKGPTAYVLAVQSVNFLFAVFLGMIFMKEKLSMKKLVSLILFVVGTTVITFFR